MSIEHPEYPAARPPRRIVRRILAGVGVFFALLAAVVFATFLFRAQLASALAPYLLARLGFPETGLVVRAIDKDRILLGEASAVLALGENPLKVRLEDAACGFAFRELLTGCIQRLEIGRAEVEFAGQGGGDSQDWTPERIARLARELPGMAAGYIEKVPLRELRIDALVLRLNLAGREWALPPLSLRYSEGGGKAALHLVQPESEATPLAVDLVLDRGGASLQGTLVADLAALSWLPVPFRFPLRGQVRADVRLTSGALTLDLQAEQFAGEGGAALAGWGAERLELAANARFAESGDLELATDSRLGITGLAGPNVALESATLPLSVVLRFASGLSADWQAGDGLRLVKARFGDWRLDELKAAGLSVKAESRAGEGALVFGPNAVLNIANFTGPGMSLESATLPLSSALRFGASGLSLDWQPGDRLRLTKGRLADLQIADIKATGLAAKAEYGAGQGARLTVVDKARIDIQKLAAPGVTFERLQGELAAQGEFKPDAQNLKWRPKNPVAVDGLVTGPVAFQPVNFRDLRLHFARNAKTAALTLDSGIPELGGPLRLTWNAKAGNPEQRLTVSAPKKLQLAPDASPLKVMRGLPAILNSISIEQGKLGAELRFSWGKSPFAASMDAELAEGALTWKGIGKLTGIELKKNRLDFAPRLTMPKAASLGVKAVDCVIPLSDIAASLQLQSPKKGAPQLVLHSARVGLADGQVRAKNCRYDFGGKTSGCAVTLHGLDLTAMHSLRSFEGLEVSGRIDGSLPFRLDKNGPGVSGGSLANAGPGVIRYKPSSEALQGSPYSEMVLKALRDYRYEKLAADVDYRPDGTLRIGLRLEGKSPELQTSRPVHLNIDSEQNVLSLLKSLQYSQGLTSELNRKVQERYQGKGAKQ